MPQHGGFGAGPQTLLALIQEGSQDFKLLPHLHESVHSVDVGTNDQFGKINYARLLTIGAWVASAFLLGQGVLAQVWLLLALGGWFTPLVVSGTLVLALLTGLWAAVLPAITLG